VEDHYAHSINYMHWGSPKTWYGVPGSQAEAFERVMREAVPELVASEQGLLYKMVTMVPPLEAAAAGVDVCHLLQQPGTFVITWPRGYHAGFSHGLNCAESSNFATADWLPWGRQSVESFRTMPGVRCPRFVRSCPRMQVLITAPRPPPALPPQVRAARASPTSCC
jgi:histone demethylase JARID1